MKLTDAERESLAASFVRSTRNPGHLAFLAEPAVEQIIAARVAAALIEAADAIKAATPTWHRGMYGCPDDMFARRDLLRIVRAATTR